METIIMCCPCCEILITVNVQDCAEGREFLCPICGKNVCFKFTPEQLDSLKDITKKNQEHTFRRQFPLAFGDR